MKKLVVFASALIFSSFLSADEVSEAPLTQDARVNIVEQRMSGKNISEVLQVALRLQMECQQEVSVDVCQGASTLVQVLNNRISALPEASNVETVAFLKGVLAGVSKANKESLSKLDSPY